MKIIIFSIVFIVFLLTTAIYLTYDTNPAFAQSEVKQIEDVNPIDELKIGDLIREGSNFKETLLATDGVKNTIQWESKPPQIFDSNQWTNYVYSDNPTYIRFESEGVAVDFFKDSCAFKLYDGGIIGDKLPSIESLSHTIAKDGIDLTTTCEVSPVTRDSESISFDTVSINGTVKVITKYYINFLRGIEWSFELQNLDVKDSTISIIDSCYKCVPDKIQGDLVSFGEYTYNPKNEQHDTLVESKQIGDDFSFKYETIVKPITEISTPIIIDPTFTGTGNGFYGGILSLAVNCNAGAESAPTSGATMGWTKWSSGSANGCQVTDIETDVSSIPDQSTITNSSFKATVSSVTSPDGSNDFTYFPINPFGATTGVQLMRAVELGTILVTTSKFTTCCPNEDVDLGTTADSKITASIQAGNNTVGIGFIDNIRARDGTTRQVVLTTSTSRLVLEYSSNVFNAGPPLNFAATNNQVMQINSTWTINNATGVSGYSIWNSTTNSTLESGWQSLVITSNFTGSQGFYLHTGLLNGSRMYYRVAAMAGNNGTNATGVGYTADVPNTPSLTATTFSSSRIDFISTAGASNGNSTVKDYGLQCELNFAGGWLNTVANSTLPANRSYNYTGLSAGDRVVCQWRDGNSVGFSSFSTNASAYTNQNPNAIVIFGTNKTGDAIELLTPRVRLTGGVPDPTITNVQLLRNGTSVNSTVLSIPITVLQTKEVGRQFLEQLNANFVYNITLVVSITNSTGNGVFTFTNSSTLPVAYTSNYFTSTEGGYQVNYTTSRSVDYTKLYLAVNRQSIPKNTECVFKDELFETGTWVNETNSGWYNQTVTVVPTKNIYVTCYNDQLLFAFTSNGGNNATLAFVDYVNQLGTFAGVPVPFIFILLLASVFTGRSAITGIIFVAITIGVMGTMGFLPDINGDPSIAAATWGLIVFLTAIGVFAGKKYF